jgi:peroxiredoxin
MGCLLIPGAALFQSAATGGEDRPAARIGFREIVERHQREALTSVATYIAGNPEADDLDQAHAWLFETAGAQGLEVEVMPAAEELLKRRDLDAPLRIQAQGALCLGLARSGKLDDAVAQFEATLPASRFQSPFRMLEMAGSLAAQARMAGKLNVSRDVLERVASAYPLNAQISEIVEGRLARQELIGQPAPQFAVRDVQGNAFDFSSLAGKVVLIDFWATNCAPCLAELPNLRQLVKEHRSAGFEIVGVSFDDSPAVVESFQQRARLPWRMVMNESPQAMISNSYRTRTIPALFVLDRQGKIAQVDVRGVDLRTVVETLLKESGR